MSALLNSSKEEMYGRQFGYIRMVSKMSEMQKTKVVIMAELGANIQYERKEGVK